MHNLKYLELADLFDLLIDQTAYHIRMISEGATPEEFARSREILSQIQREIEIKKPGNRSAATITTSQDQPSLQSRSLL